MDKVQKSVILSVIPHSQNPSDSDWLLRCLSVFLEGHRLKLFEKEVYREIYWAKEQESEILRKLLKEVLHI
jgi:hypothetical protein